MGCYIYVGIATKIIVEKRRGGYRERIFSTDEILDKLAGQFNLDLYNIAENSQVVGLALKDKVIESYLYDFLYEQSYDLECGKEIREEIEKLKNKDAHQILQMFKYYVLEYIYYNDQDYTRETYLDSDLKLYIEGITYLSDGKIMIECYQEFLRYIHRLIRKATDNPIKDATYLTIV